MALVELQSADPAFGSFTLAEAGEASVGIARTAATVTNNSARRLLPAIVIGSLLLALLSGQATPDPHENQGAASLGKAYEERAPSNA
jgi:hypothetical protein